MRLNDIERVGMLSREDSPPDSGELLKAIQHYMLETYLDNDDSEACLQCKKHIAVFAIQTAEDDYTSYCLPCLLRSYREDLAAETSTT